MKRFSGLMSVVEGLHFQEDRSEQIARIAPEMWPELLKRTDAAQLTLPLAIRRRSRLPEEVQIRTDRNLVSNARRSVVSRELYTALARELDARGNKFVVLKGMTHYPFYCDDPAHRPQFDLDLYCPRESLHGAAEAAASLGYEPVRAHRGAPVDHLPAMIRRTGFRWQGDYYDPDLPLSVEIHFRFWNPRQEAFHVFGAEGFWERRARRNVGGCEVWALAPADDLAYTTWHLVKHLVRGNLRLYHVYELAHFLDRTASSNSFWESWQAAATGPRVAEPIAFRLASEWFGCRMHPSVREEIERLPAPVGRWFRLFAFSPVHGMEKPNKDELFLHLMLAKGAANRLRIAAHKLVPVNPPRVVMDAHVQEDGPALRARRFAFRIVFLLKRARHHARAWGPILQSGVRWWLAAWRAA